MTSPTGNKLIRGINRREGGAFTLIEFILVMALLSVVFALALPSLSNFFRGRGLDSEARRLVSLTRYAKSRAVSEGMPMVLWIDARAKAYGLELEGSLEGADPKALTFEMDPEIAIEVDTAAVPRLLPGVSMTDPGVRLAGVSQPRFRRSVTAAIRFQPDGFIGLNSPAGVTIRELDRPGSARAGNEIRIGQTANRLQYEIQTNNSATIR